MPKTILTFEAVRETSLHGRYITLSHLRPLIDALAQEFQREKIGESVLGKSIETITLGTGERKVLIWSQMHGNESTTTKAVFDLLRFLQTSDPLTGRILSNCKLKVIPMLNPDGAEVYTRVNANEVDLNRDAQDLSQPESKVLRKVYDQFEPDFCFNLHDQRTIFNVGTSAKPATVSFLAPAFDQERGMSGNRSRSMQLIVAMNAWLQSLIPGQVGRYDDAFNPNCVGDTFQMLGTPTILFEAGHFPGDYERERTREFIFEALLQALHTIATDNLSAYALGDYFGIPENGKQFYDVLIENAHLISSDYVEGQSVAILFKEKLEDATIHFQPELSIIETGTTVFGHSSFDCAKPGTVQLLKKVDFSALLF